MIGGSELAALRSFRILATEHDVAVIHLHETGPLHSDYAAAGAELHHLPIFSIRDPRNLAAVYRLKRLLRAMQADVVHSHDSYSNMIMLAAQAVSRTAPWVASRRWLDQIVRPVHARLNHRAFLLADAVSVNSRTVAEHMVAHEGVPRSQVHVIDNFVDLPARWREMPAASASVVTVGMVSRLTSIKRHDIAIRAIQQLVAEGLRIRLVIVGDGEHRQQIAASIRDAGMSSHVHLTGSRIGGPELQLEFDVALSTSDSEGSPNSVLEAMAAGRAIVATNVGGTGDLIQDSVDGLLVPAGSVDAVAEALRRVAQSSDLRRKLGTAARERAEADFSASTARHRLLSLYRAVIESRPNRASHAKTLFSAS